MGRARTQAQAPRQFEHGDDFTEKHAAQMTGRVDVPTLGRVQKSNGFAVSVLVDATNPTIRVREKAILTPPEVRREMIAEAIASLRTEGRFEVSAEDIRIKETAADRLLSPVEHEAVCRYIRVHARVMSGHAGISDYGQKIRRAAAGEEDSLRPIVDYEKWMHAELQKVLPEPHLSFLDWLAWHEYSSMRDGVPPSKIDIGRAIIDSRDARRAEGAAEAFIRAVAQNISHWEGEIETVQRRKLLAVKELAAHRKKAFR